MDLTFHHLGLAVRRPEAAKSFLSAQGFEIGSEVYDAEQNVNLILCRHSTEPDIEIIWPGKGTGPVDGMIKRHASGLVYHTCYTTHDLGETLRAIERAGLDCVCVSPPKVASLFGGDKVSFYSLVGIGLIEILEQAAKPR